MALVAWGLATPLVGGDPGHAAPLRRLLLRHAHQPRHVRRHGSLPVHVRHRRPRPRAPRAGRRAFMVPRPPRRAAFSSTCRLLDAPPPPRRAAARRLLDAGALLRQPAVIPQVIPHLSPFPSSPYAGCCSIQVPFGDMC